jgi:hypothetical protein
MQGGKGFLVIMATHKGHVDHTMSVCLRFFWIYFAHSIPSNILHSSISGDWTILVFVFLGKLWNAFLEQTTLISSD